MSKFRAFAITLSPKDPVEGQLQQEITDWLASQDYAYGIIEGDGVRQKRHFHGAVFYDSPKEKGSLKRYFVRLLSKLSPDSTSNAIYIKTLYNEDWKEEYLSKDIQDTLRDAVPEDTGEFYPSLKEQAKVLEKSNAVDKRYHQMEVDFRESKYYTEEGITLNAVQQFMHSAYFVDKLYKVEPDARKRTQACKCLLEYVLADPNRYKNTCYSEADKEREKQELLKQHALEKEAED